MSWLDDTMNFLGAGNSLDGLYGSLFNRPGQDQANKYLPQGSPYLDPATIEMLRARAQGNGPSIAGNAYTNAAQNGLAQQMALSRGGGAGAGRQAAMNMGNINQGMANGYATARNQEMMGATGQLVGAQQGNQQAWLDMLRQLMGGKTVADNMSGVIQGAAKAASMAA